MIQAYSQNVDLGSPTESASYERQLFFPRSRLFMANLYP